MHLTHLRRLGLEALVMIVLLVAFTWPSGRLAPRGLPVGVVGSVPAATAAPRGLELHRYATAADARDAIGDRQVLGAFAGGRTYVATAASPAVAQRLRQLAPGTAVTDLAPGTRHDPQAATVGSMTLPISILGILVGVLSALTARGRRDRLVALLGGGLLAGVLTAAITQTWLQAIPGPWLALAGSAALATLAVGALVAGLVARLGPPGIAVGAVLAVLVGNAWSGASSAPELLPAPASAIGSLLPPGAFGQLVRSVGWFDGAGAAAHVAVLAGWAAAGLALLLLPAPRDARPGLARHDGDMSHVDTDAPAGTPALG